MAEATGARHLSCPTCGADYRPQQVNVALGIASCEPCGTVHDLSRRAGSAAARTPADPAGFTVVEGDAPEISYAWRGWILLFLVVWCVFWDSMVLVGGASAVAEGELSIVWFLSVHALAGLAVTYLTVATAVNRTHVRLVDGELRVEHGPLPWFGNRALLAQEVHQVYVIEDRSAKGARSYSVHARVAPGHPVRLLGQLPNPGKARFVETWLEQQLGLIDAPVQGEHT